MPPARPRWLRLTPPLAQPAPALRASPLAAPHVTATRPAGSPASNSHSQRAARLPQSLPLPAGLAAAAKLQVPVGFAAASVPARAAASNVARGGAGRGGRARERAGGARTPRALPRVHLLRGTMHRRHLKEIPASSSNVFTSFTWAWDPTKTSELLSGMGVSVLKKEHLGSENTPQDLLVSLSPQKRQKVKEKDKDFVIARRPRLLREPESGASWDALPDELLLGIFAYLPLNDLLKVTQVCKRWYRLSFDESLWQTLDLTGKNLLPGVIGQLLPVGVTVFRCPRSCIGEPSFKHNRPLRLQHLDLSNCTVNVADLHSVLHRCRRLQNLSLEGLKLSDDIIRNIAQNSSLVRLNLSGCSGFSAEALETMLSICSGLQELNLSWCDFTADHVQAAVSHISSKVTQLNLSGYRQNLQISEQLEWELLHKRKCKEDWERERNK